MGLFTETQLGSTLSASLPISPPFYFNRLAIHHLAGLLGTCWVSPTPSPRTAQASSRGSNQVSGLCSLSSSLCCSPALSCASHTEWWSRKTASVTGTAVFLTTTDSYSRTLARGQLTGYIQKSPRCNSLEDASHFPSGLKSLSALLQPATICTTVHWENRSCSAGSPRFPVEGKLYVLQMRPVCADLAWAATEITSVNLMKTCPWGGRPWALSQS